MRHSAKFFDIDEDAPLVGILSVDHGDGEKEIARFKINAADDIATKRLPSLKEHWDKAGEIKLEFGQMRNDILISMSKPENDGKYQISGNFTLRHNKKTPKKLEVFGQFYRYGGEHLSIHDMEEKVLAFERGLEF